MKKLAVVAALFVAVVSRLQAGPLPPVGCPTCIQNSAAPQNAQINIGTATIRGTLSVGTLSVTNLTITTLNATTINGNGAGITALNASALASGTVPSARVAGAYSGITGLGTIVSGAWNGTVIGTQYGGTGQNWASTNIGSLPYFSAAGTMAALAPSTANKLLQTNGAAAPTWTAAPTILGTNITAIPPANLAAGNLPTNVAVANGSIVTVAGTKVTGDIAGNAENINGSLPLGQLANGTLGAGVIAQTLTNTGVVAGTYAALPSRTVQLVINAQGRITSAAQVNIAIDPSQITSGALPGGVTIPAANVSAGNLGAGVVAQTLTNTGVTAGTYGGPTQAAQIIVNAQGRVTSATQFAIPGVSTRTAWIDQDNGWHGPGQTSFSSWTFVNNVGIGGTLSLTNALAVTSGGTGRATITANAIPYGAGTSALGLLPVLGSGGLIIGTGGVPSTGTITGTSNQVIVTNGAGAITLSLPQSIGTGNSPTFASLTLSSPLTVPNGGTGATSVTNHGVVIGQGSSALLALPAMGALGIVVGNTTSVDPSTAALAGTSNQVVVTRSASAITFSLPQDINAGASPTFSGLSLTNALTVPNGGTGAQTLTNHGMLYGNGTGAVAALPAMADGGLVIGAGTGVTPTTGTLAGTSNQVVVTRGGAGFTLSTPQDIGTGSSPTFAALTLSSPLTVANGGSGAATITANGVVVGNGTSAMFALPAMGAGGIITGSGTSVRPSTGTLTGTSNQVIVTQTGSNIVLSGPQDLGTGSSPSFVTVTAALAGNATSATKATNLDGGLANEVPYQTGAGATTFTAQPGANVVLFANSGAPAWTNTPTLTGTNFSGTAASLTAGAATNLASGLVGQIPYQTAAGATSFLPAMGAGGIVTGNGTSAIPSTGTFSGTSNQIVITRTGSNIVLSAPQNINSGASPTFDGTNFTGIPASGIGSGTLAIARGGTNLGSAGGTANQVLRTSDGTTFAMGQVIGPDIAVGTIPVSALNQSGASPTNILAWNGSAWAPSAGASGNMVTTSVNTMGAGSGSIVFPQGSTITVTTPQTNQSGINGSTTTILEPAHAGGLWVVAGSTNSAASVSSWTIHGFDLYGTTIAFHCVVIACASGSNMDLNMQVNYDASGNHHLGSNTSGQSVGSPGNECALTMQISNRAVADGNCGLAQFFVHPGMGPTASKQTYMTGTIMNYGDSGLSNQDSNPFSCRYDGNAGKLKAITFKIGGNDGSGRFYQDTRCTAIGQ